MSKHSYHGSRQVYVVCPFFRGYTPTTLRCEGFDDGVGTTSTFPNRARQTQHMEIFCYKHYEKCEVFRMVMDAKYHDEK